MEIPEDVAFTVEYSVRAAQTAVYQLLTIARPVTAITLDGTSLHTRFEALLKAFKQATRITASQTAGYRSVS